MKKLLFGLLAIIGLFVAVCTADDCPNELAFRAGGTAAFGVFTFLGGWWDTEKTAGNSITKHQNGRNNENQGI